MYNQNNNRLRILEIKWKAKKSEQEYKPHKNTLKERRLKTVTQEVSQKRPP